MRNLIFFDNDDRDHLLPLTYTRPMAELRVGILSIREKWERMLEGEGSHITQEYLAPKFPITIRAENYVINGGVLPSRDLATLVSELDPNEALMSGEELIAARLSEEQFQHLISNEEIEELRGYELGDTAYLQIRRPWDIFSLNGKALESDFELLTGGRTSAPLSNSNQVISRDRIFVEEGATVECAVLNAGEGPIYIGKNATIMEGVLVRGGLALGEGSVLKLGAKIYGPTTIGPYSKVGGEVNNSVIQAYSNKGHDGFLGNSVLGEWCNLGADTNNSNLKNNYTEVRAWNYVEQRFVPTGLQFCGLIMGDHSKCGINTMFNTGTVVGVFANIFGSGFPRNFIPSFSWGGAKGLSTYRFRKAAETAPLVMQRRGKVFSEEERAILQHVYEETASYRVWEKKTEDLPG